MKIRLHKDFKKSYKKRIASNVSLVKRFRNRIALFSIHPTHPILQNHKLSGDKIHCGAFSVTGDIRIVYAQISKREVIFLDIGTHNQVY